ncbi:hypothetical protein HYV49_04950 [Candidatus Pacearchaeota archaeon]|nr:hypothetical protein [Candidatus Pacearchaeota archaeon]
MKIKSKGYKIKYYEDTDFLEIIFDKSRNIIYDYEVGGDENVFMKRDKRNGKILALGVAALKEHFLNKSPKLERFLKNFGVVLPQKIKNLS